VPTVLMEGTRASASLLGHAPNRRKSSPPFVVGVPQEERGEEGDVEGLSGSSLFNRLLNAPPLKVFRRLVVSWTMFFVMKGFT